MKIIHRFFLVLTFFLFFNCKNRNNTSDKTKTTTAIEKEFSPYVSPITIQEEFVNWWRYHNENIILSTNFIGINQFDVVIEKNEFLQNLISGEFIPIKIKNNENQYKLFEIKAQSPHSIRNTIINVSKETMKNFKMENNKFPEFNFLDIEGKMYNNENTKDKIIILKCWFIGCTACVKEFPELNELVEKYKERDDIVFLSLALDDKDDLTFFLKKKPFSYPIVPNSEKFMKDSLEIITYPTHIIINKDKTIKKVVNSFKELMIEIKESNLLGKNDDIPPPPPNF